ncbi:O-antigen ligase family protein [Phenylobacterium soli]|uniref:O-antigen ligase-related domain-containing protein n=1 Tax=Phenylobacterium soli TaxID=2170551 RepID=A0A328AQ10_9CAUL|nr:O-antigen ligase family protein [Phenylobacterium soli]RAK55836.1 hypothetical protein DJ017_15620 [Phenylobacterium soli]
MTSAWDARPGSPQGGSPRIRRIRGGGESEPPPRPHARPGPRVVPVELVEVRPHRAEGLPLGRTGLDVDGLFAFVLFLPMLFLGQLTTMGAAMIAALTPLYLFVRRDRLLDVMLPRSFMFLVPAFAIFSVTWSQAPGESLKYAVELAITVTAGLLLSSARSQEAVLRGIALAFLTYVVASLFFGGYVGVGVGMGGEAFSGLTESKNLLADIASTGLVVSAVVSLMALQGRRWLWVLIGGLAMALDLYCVVAARSAGALLGLGMAIMGLAALTPLVYAGKVVRAWATSAVGLCLIAIGIGYSTLAQAMINLGASIFDKDPTLTGRTYLWYRAGDLIAEKPMLGRGFYAFWLQGNIDAEGLWRFFGIDGRGGFTFHNTYVEILVMLGWAGLILIALTVLTGVAFLIRRFVVKPNLQLVFWIAILLYELARTPIETIGVAPFYFSTVLVFGAMGAAFDRARAPRGSAAAAVQAAPAQPWAVESFPGGWAHQRPPHVGLRLVKPARDGQ